MTKTNAVRALETLGIPFELKAYDVDEADLSATTVARKVGLPAEQVFKTLLVRGDRQGLSFAVVPGDSTLDLKALALATGDRKVELVPLKEVQPLTGYIRGGVTVFAAKKDLPVVVDETVILFDIISVSAGMRGLQIFLHPDDYLRAAKAKLAPIARELPAP
jgi:Cys-tRNA(Pro)/Cys-tRNA(Cys) deacylase